MHIFDLEGKKITITDLDVAIADAERFSKYRHTDRYAGPFDKERGKYWKDLLKKLKAIKQQQQ